MHRLINKDVTNRMGGDTRKRDRTYVVFSPTNRKGGDTQKLDRAMQAYSLAHKLKPVCELFIGSVKILDKAGRRPIRENHSTKFNRSQSLNYENFQITKRSREACGCETGLREYNISLGFYGHKSDVLQLSSLLNLYS